MQSYGLTLMLKDDEEIVDRYKDYHRNAWPEVIARLREIGIVGMKIYLIARRMFMYMEAVVIRERLRGYSVPPMLDAKSFSDLYDVRRLLEPFAARRAAELRDEKVLRALDRELAEMRRMVGTSGGATASTYHDYREFALQDARFHEAIAGTSGNSLLHDTLRRLRSHLRLYRLYHRYYTLAIGKATVLEHEKILASIRGRDGDGAEAAMLDHIDHSRDRSEGARVRIRATESD